MWGTERGCFSSDSEYAFALGRVTDAYTHVSHSWNQKYLSSEAKMLLGELGVEMLALSETLLTERHLVGHCEGSPIRCQPATAFEAWNRCAAKGDTLRHGPYSLCGLDGLMVTSTT
jgi:hypothetical protein